MAPLLAVDIDFIIAFHHIDELLEERLLGDDAELASDQLPAAREFQKGFRGAGAELKALPPIGGVKVAEFLFPLRQFFPFHEAVVRKVRVGVVAEQDFGPLAEGHGDIAVVAARAHSMKFVEKFMLSPLQPSPKKSASGHRTAGSAASSK